MPGHCVKPKKWVKRVMSTEPLHFKIRLPPEMHTKLKDFAAKNHRTMSAEILARVASTFENEEFSDYATMYRQGQVNGYLDTLDDEEFDILKEIIAEIREKRRPRKKK